jgi:hypothetical protein
MPTRGKTGDRDLPAVLVRILPAAGRAGTVVPVLVVPVLGDQAGQPVRVTGPA